ncbi:MAG: RNA polymerase sigma factor [Bifidobacteriaceae bacterium]|jgi:RNA polymerase sigma-70 factor (ECF subfamily)|nr:RNA polymerase sigma factor [Bifidobacteriaceae bacterium]
MSVRLDAGSLSQVIRPEDESVGAAFGAPTAPTEAAVPVEPRLPGAPPLPVVEAALATQGADDAVERAFADLFRTEYPRIVAYLLRRVGEAETARDLAAEVFSLAWERGLEDSLPQAPWLFVTARNLLANHLRASVRVIRLQRVVVNELSRDLGSSAVNNPQERTTDLQERVYRGLDALSEEQREILIAHYWDGLSGAECGALLGCSVPAVWMRLSRARAAFKTLYLKSEDQS